MHRNFMQGQCIAHGEHIAGPASDELTRCPCAPCAHALMQDMGYRVDVLVRHDNQCQTVEFLLGTAQQLRRQLDPRRLAVKAVNITGMALQVGAARAVLRTLRRRRLPLRAQAERLSF